ncbi:S-layer homology domain-containing protein [Planococcus salinus]|nr:S-layer homology domain-containing protein [Planococcus salinus]
MKYIDNNWAKFMATGAAAALVATAAVPAAGAQDAGTPTFTDVAPQYVEAVEYIVGHGLANGLTETQFGVSDTIKRGDAAIILAKALRLPTEAAPDSGFTDVPERGMPAINALKAAGIVNGKSDARFGFNDSLTRGEVALLLANAKAYNLQGYPEQVTFTDVNDRYLDSVAGLVAHGITDGRSATQFGTSEDILRGEFAIFIHRAETLTADEDVVTGLVSEVLAIDETGVTVLLNENVEAQEAAAIEVRDPDGKTVPVVPRAIEAGAETVSFDFEVALSEVLFGTWTVDGVAFDTGVSVIIDQVNTSTNELELQAALDSSYFDDVNDNLYTDYLEAMEDVEFDSLEEVQTVIDQVNGDVSLREQQAAAVLAVNAAGTQEELDAALRNEQFLRYCEEWIADYESALSGGESSVGDIQSAIDEVNAENVEPVFESAISGVDEAEIADARFLVETFIQPDDINSEQTPKQDMLEALETQRALVAVHDSSDEAELLEAFHFLVETTDEFDLLAVNNSALPDYFEALAGKGYASVEVLNDAITAVNALVEADGVAAVTAAASAEELHELLIALEYRCSFGSKGFVMDDVNKDLLEDYLQALAGTELLTAADVTALIRSVK